MKTIIIDSERQKRFCQTMLEKLPPDGSKTVVFKNTDKSSTAKQRRLQWLWSTEIASSGLGQDDTKEAVHITAKRMFAHPILMRDDAIYPILYKAFKDAVKTSENYESYIRTFIDRYVSTEDLSRKQRAEYLTEMQFYWTDKGVKLTDPSLEGVDQYLLGKNIP